MIQKPKKGLKNDNDSIDSWKNLEAYNGGFELTTLTQA